jgi:hypothetical protein
MLSFLWCLFFSGFISAQSSSVVVTINGQAQTVPFKFGFVKLDEQARALTLRVSINIPGGAKATAATGDGVFFLPQWQKNPGKAVIGLGALTSQVAITLDNGQTLQLQAQVRLAKTLLKEEGCKTAGLKIKGKNLNKVPLFIGVKCEKTKDRTLLHISVPQELEWDATNVFEVAGKGERWKVYDLSQIGVRDANNQLATFNLRWNNTLFSLILIQTKGQKQQPVIPLAEPLIKTRVGLGVASVSYTTPTLSGGGVAPLLYLDALTKPYFWKMRARTALQFGMPLAGQQFYEFSVATGPGFDFGAKENPSTFMVMFEYIGLGQQESEKSVTFSHNQMGLSFSYKLAMTNSSLTFLGSYNGLGGDSTHMGVNVFYDKLMASRRSWGVLLGYQMQSATSVITGNSSDFGQILAAGTYTF